MYKAYVGLKPISRTNIISKILRAQIDTSLMHEALTTLYSSRMTPFTREEAGDFVGGYVTRKTPFQFDTRNGLDLSELHSHVEFFAKRFASFALSRKLATGSMEKDMVTISRSELTRIERTLYRFELYNNLFAVLRRSGSARNPTWTISERGSYLSDVFAPWENEQLACIRDYLLEELSACTWRPRISVKRPRVANMI